jgi:hypothetical protein
MGKVKEFKTPDELYTAFQGYKDSLKEQANQWLKVQYVGKNGERKEDGQKVPMTLEGFKRYCRENHSEVHNYFVNSDNRYDEYNTICSRIKEEIREDQIIGGLLGFYNPSITQRLNGLTEKTENKNENTEKITITLGN